MLPFWITIARGLLFTSLFWFRAVICAASACQCDHCGGRLRLSFDSDIPWVTITQAYNSPEHVWRPLETRLSVHLVRSLGLGVRDADTLFYGAGLVSTGGREWTLDAYICVFLLEPQRLSDQAAHHLAPGRGYATVRERLEFAGRTPSACPTKAQRLLGMFERAVKLISEIQPDYQDRALARLSELFGESFPTLDEARRRVESARESLLRDGQLMPPLRVEFDSMILSRFYGPVCTSESLICAAMMEAIRDAGFRVQIHPRYTRYDHDPWDPAPSSCTVWIHKHGTGSYFARNASPRAALLDAAEQAGIRLRDDGSLQGP